MSSTDQSTPSPDPESSAPGPDTDDADRARPAAGSPAGAHPATVADRTGDADLARITAAPVGTPPPSRSSTVGAAWRDLTRGFQQRELWLALGWQDIKQRYRRSVLGPLWITISRAVMALALGLLYSLLFEIDLKEFLPHVAVGLIIWDFIAGCVIEGSQVFIANEGLIKQLPSALSVHVYRLVWRQFLFMCHNLVIWLALLVIFRIPVGWEVLYAVPGIVLLVANGVWVTMFFGIVSTRFRDVAPLLESLVQLAFYMTPIVWSVSIIERQGGAAADRAVLAEFNPFFHYLSVVRGPMIDEPVEMRSWLIVIALTVAGTALALAVMRKWRFRVSYWV